MSTQTTKADNRFEIDVAKICDDAHKHMDAGAVTAGNTIDIDRLVGVLNEVIATEVVCYLRYSQHAIAATGIDRAQVDGEDPRAGGGACRRPQRPARQLTRAQP